MSCEIILKVIAFKKKYLIDPWNIFDISVIAIGWINFGFQLNHEDLAFDSELRVLDGIAKGF